MEYLAFALKYRPQNFDEVIGQGHVVVSLRNAILKNRIHHAYLFSGPRGTGKTSLARILAKSLNCSQGPTINPCGKCPNCLEIIRGTSLDIIEIDGASNRGIDEMRTLRENVKLSTAGSRYKIYIIDEVHMLTQEAFNALLKTLEEPPRHVKFIFATTHPHKVLPTILSRCQKFQFNLLPLEKIVEKLKKIVEAEGLEIQDSLLYAIARAGEGSIRDAESLLDQIAPVILEKKPVEDILSFLGIIDEEVLNSTLKALVEKDLSASLEIIDKIVKGGKDLGIFLNALLEHLRNLLLAKVSVKGFGELIDISCESKDFILKIAELISASEVLKIIDLLIEAKDLSGKLNTVRIPLELAVIKFSYQEKEKSAPSEKKNNEAGRKNSELKAVGQIAESEEKTIQSSAQLKNDFDLEMADFELEEESSVNVDDGGDRDESQELPDDNILVDGLKLKWREIIAYIQKSRAAIASHLLFAQPFSSQDSLVKIAYSKKDYFHKEIVEDSKNLKVIEDAVSKFMNKKIGIKFIFVEGIPAISQNSFKQEAVNNTEAEDNFQELDQDNEFIDGLIDTFRGSIHAED